MDQDKQHNLQPAFLSSGGMNTLGHKLVDLTAHIPGDPSVEGLQISLTCRYRASEVNLAHEQQFDIFGQPHLILYVVAVEGRIPVEGSAFGQVEVEDFQSLRIARRTGNQEGFHGLALGGGQDKELHAVEVIPFAGIVAPVVWVSVQPNSIDADLVAYRHRETIQHVEAAGDASLCILEYGYPKKQR